MPLSRKKRKKSLWSEWGSVGENQIPLLKTQTSFERLALGEARRLPQCLHSLKVAGILGCIEVDFRNEIYVGMAKALDEIYQIHILLHLSNRKTSVIFLEGVEMI